MFNIFFLVTIRAKDRKTKSLENQGFSWQYLFYSPYLVEATGICRFRFAEPRQGVVMPTTFVFFPIIVCGHHSREPTVIRGFRETQRRNNKKIQHISDVLYFLVEATGLEPTTSWSLTKRATKLRYASICCRPLTA